MGDFADHDHADQMTPPPTGLRDRAQRWFLSRGLPLVLPPTRRARRLVRRTMPVVTAFAGFELMISVLLAAFDVTDAELDQRLSGGGWLGLFWVLVVAVVVVPVSTGLATTRLLRSFAGPVATVSLMAVAIVAVPVADLLIGNGGLTLLRAVGPIAANLAAVLVLLAANYAGAGAILRWALGFGWRQLSALAMLSARLLPLLLITVVIFFTGELWLWAAVVDRRRLWQTVGLLSAAALVFMVVALRDEVSRLSRTRPDPAETRRLLVDTPLFGLAPDPDRAADQPPRRPLARREKLNVLGVLLLAQAIQVVLVTLAILAFFLLLGAVMIPDQIIATWSGQPVSDGSWFGLRVPIPCALENMSIFVAVVSGLYLTVNTSTDPAYRTRFFDPLINDVAVSLAARDIYLARLAQPGDHGSS